MLVDGNRGQEKPLASGHTCLAQSRPKAGIELAGAGESSGLGMSFCWDERGSGKERKLIGL